MVHFPLLLACLCRQGRQGEARLPAAAAAQAGVRVSQQLWRGILDRSRNWPITTVKRQEMTLKRPENVKKLAE